jgi:hypothetical protein
LDSAAGVKKPETSITMSVAKVANTVMAPSAPSGVNEVFAVLCPPPSTFSVEKDPGAASPCGMTCRYPWLDGSTATTLMTAAVADAGMPRRPVTCTSIDADPASLPASVPRSMRVSISRCGDMGVNAVPAVARASAAASGALDRAAKAAIGRLERTMAALPTSAEVTRLVRRSERDSSS